MVRRRHRRQAVVVRHGNVPAKVRGLVHVHGGLAQAEHAPVRVDLVGRQDAALCVTYAAHQHHPVPRHAHGRAALKAVVGVVTARREHVEGSHNVLLVDDPDVALVVVGVHVTVDDPGALGRERGAGVGLALPVDAWEGLQAALARPGRGRRGWGCRRCRRRRGRGRGRRCGRACGGVPRR